MEPRYLLKVLFTFPQNGCERISSESFQNKFKSPMSKMAYDKVLFIYPLPVSGVQI
jgi:hypothetical protein